MFLNTIYYFLILFRITSIIFKKTSNNLQNPRLNASPLVEICFAILMKKSSLNKILKRCINYSLLFNTRSHQILLWDHQNGGTGVLQLCIA